MNGYDSLPDAVTEIFGEEATAERAYDLLTVDVPPSAWLTALETARDALGCTYFDWLSAVDEPGTGFRVCAHVVALGTGGPRRLLLRTTVPHEAAALPTAIGVYAGAGWHERETHEMFGVAFEGHPHLVPLLLPENFEGHPLRKDFVLAARVAKAWPGAKEPGESHDGGPKRRQMLPPGVPDPNEWGPLKGQLPPAPARPARAAAGDRPVRRTRTATEGSATQTADPAAPVRRSRTASEGSATQAAAESAAPARRSRTASEGSASQTAAAAEQDAAPDAPAARPPRRSRSASDGSASQTTPEPGTSPEAQARPPRRSRSAADGSASQQAPDTAAPRAGAAAPRTRSSDAPWHHARPAFDDETPPPATPSATETPAPTAAPEPEAPAPADPQAPESEAPAPENTPSPEPEAPAPVSPQAPESEAPAPEGTPTAEPEPEPEAQAPTPAPAPAATPAPKPDAPKPDAPKPDAPAPAAPQAPQAEDARAAGADGDRAHEPPAGRDRTDTPNNPAGGDPA
ncbi:NADH-quinone oxidoreductase subunit C [Streptomyces globisporus]|uniref:NADH-quinone oxidoreductase subunit C n=1 Tax=Streptomyces globisporus TaxID=1908 RepID=UPI0004CBAFC8|nr:NADH-quinone oxidoreductase subunit C [Streptomyces globisporus]